MQHRSHERVDPPYPNGGRPGKPGLLVVDDDRLMRLMVKLGLERNGFEVWLAPSGREAIELGYLPSSRVRQG